MNLRLIHSIINFFSTCLLIDSICDSILSQSIDVTNLNISQNVHMADLHFNQSSLSDLLIGADLFW